MVHPGGLAYLRIGEAFQGELIHYALPPDGELPVLPLVEGIVADDLYDLSQPGLRRGFVRFFRQDGYCQPQRLPHILFVGVVLFQYLSCFSQCHLLFLHWAKCFLLFR